MNVAELISKLQQHDRAAAVVLRWDWDGTEVAAVAAAAFKCIELRAGQVQAVSLHKLPASSSWYDPLGGAVLYDEIDDENDHRAAVPGVLLG